MLQDIKKEFFALRNGIIADTLRKAGMHYKVIFGLQVPQISSIARKLKESGNSSQPIEMLAEALWADSEVRESRILACYLFSPENVNIEKALQLASEVKTTEESDMLAFRLFKHLSYAPELLKAMEDDPNIPGWAASSLKRHFE